jgi:hypothetical protein
LLRALAFFGGASVAEYSVAEFSVDANKGRRRGGGGDMGGDEGRWLDSGEGNPASEPWQPWLWPTVAPWVETACRPIE